MLHLSLVALTAYGYYDTPPVAPQTERMEPRTGKPGTIVKITGKSLDKGHVDEVYLTDHRFDMKVKVLEQSATLLVVRIPPFVKPGRLQLLLLTPGSNPVYLEQPLYLQIEAGDEELAPPTPLEISRKSKSTVEVAAGGTNVPVPMAGTAPSVATSAVEKRVVPLKAQPLTRVAAAEAPRPAPAPVSAKPAEVASATLPANPVQAPVQPIEMQTQTQAPVPAHAPAIQNQPAPGTAGNVPAQLVKKTRVSYPSGAAAQRAEGVVELLVVVRTDGRVKDVKVLKGNPFLVGAAIASVREWLYEPAYVQGRPVESEVPVMLNFKRSPQ